MKLVVELCLVRGRLPVGVSLGKETPVVCQWTVGGLATRQTHVSLTDIEIGRAGLLCGGQHKYCRQISALEKTGNVVAVKWGGGGGCEGEEIGGEGAEGTKEGGRKVNYMLD